MNLRSPPREGDSYRKEYQSLSHTRWDGKYHVVFTPKRRKKKVFGVLRRHLGEMLHELAKHKESKIVEGHLMADHIHMCISIPPKHAVSNVVGDLKGSRAQPDCPQVRRSATQLHRREFLGPRLFRLHRWVGRGDSASVHSKPRGRGRALRSNEARSVAAAFRRLTGLSAPLRRSPNKPPALPGVI